MALRGFVRRYWIGLVLSAVWLVGAATVLDHQRGVEVGRLARECHQLQDDARASKLCSEANAAVAQPLCRFKDADCDHWPYEQARFAEKLAWFAVAPLVLAWLIFYAMLRYCRWQRP